MTNDDIVEIYLSQGMLAAMKALQKETQALKKKVTTLEIESKRKSIKL